MDAPAGNTPLQTRCVSGYNEKKRFFFSGENALAGEKRAFSFFFDSNHTEDDSYDRDHQSAHSPGQCSAALCQGPFCHQSQPHQLLHRHHLPEDPAFRGQSQRLRAGVPLHQQYACGYHHLPGRYGGAGNLCGRGADQVRLLHSQPAPDDLCSGAGIQRQFPDDFPGERDSHD